MINFISIIAGAAVAINAYAFQLDDHERIMDQAVVEFSHCFPGYNKELNLKALVQGDLDEDTNLINKELFYSHFYNPHKKLNMWRMNSEERVENLEPGLLQCRSSNALWTYDELAGLGHALHHFQDMAVPAHVIPVHHSFWDGFESYPLHDEISSGWNCTEMARSCGDDFETVVKETAEETLRAVDRFKIESVVKGTHSTVEVRGLDFWIESMDAGFGSYGTLGNAYGLSEVDSDKGRLQISDDAYRQFKQQQMKLAVQSTLRGLVWAFRPAALMANE